MARGIATWGVLIALFACKEREARRSPSPPPPRDADVDPLSTLRWDDAPLDWSRPIATRTRELDGFAGSESCKACHEQIYASYMRHSMASTGLRRIETLDAAWTRKIFDAGTPVKHDRSGFSYRPVRRGTKFFVEETLLAGDGSAIARWDEPVTHVLSAGSYGLALYSHRGDALVHLPIDYYAKARRWDLDPVAFGANPRFSSTLGPFCASCHIDEPAQRFADPLPHGIGCERCHGPSKRHIESLAVEDTVNPRKLPPLRQLDICTQCHQSTSPILRDERDHFGFRPGEPLDGFRVNFIGEPPERDRVKLLVHSERLVRSACWQRSRDKMTCTTCHDPHVSSLEQKPAWWDGKCMQCHERAACTETDERRAAVGDRCVTCHMRTGSTGDVPLVAITDHWIQTRPPPIRPGAIAKPKRLVPWSAHVGEPVRDDAMAALAALGHADAGLGDEAIRLAVAAVRTRPSAALYRMLATAYLQRRRSPEAGRAFAAALRLDLDDRTALLGYARNRLDAGATAEALRALDRMLAIDADDVAALETLGIYRYRTNERARATELFRRAVETGRATAVSYVGLAIEARGQTAKQLEWLELAWRAEPRDRWILDELARAAEASGDRARIAELARRRAQLEQLSPPPGPTSATAWLPN